MREKSFRKIIAIGIVVLYGLCCTYLYYRQSLSSWGSVYESDLPAHISMAVDDGWYYSLTAFAYLFFFKFGNAGYVLTAVFLGVSTVLSIVFCDILIKEIVVRDKAGNRFLADDANRLFVALILNVVMPCYVSGISNGRYIGMQSASIWHNSTYIVMKWMALLSLVIYLRIERNIEEGIKAKEWIGFAVVQALCSAVKPSFLVVFAPIMLVFLIRDLIRGVKLSRLFVFGCSILPACCMILLQNAVLFGDDTGNGITFAPGAVMSHYSYHPLIAAGLSILFPLFILVTHINEIRKNNIMIAAWMMALIGFLQYFLLAETGHRAMDGNFSWGYAFSIIGIFIVSTMILLKDIETFIVEKKKMKLIILIPGGLVLMWHVYCGAVFFAKLMMGTSYYMWA